jgi:hypothetical protein
MKYTPVLDFARDRAARQRGKKVIFAALGLIFGLQVGVMAWRFQSLESARSSLDTQLRQLTGKGARTDSTLLTVDQIKATGSAQAMLDSLVVPWDGLLSAIEAARTNRILVDTIQPRTEDGSVSISVSCPDFAGVAEFVQRLAHQELLHDVKLVSETLPDNGGGSLRAVISANWRKTP